ncbi:MAG: hypothetical protein JSS36_12900, partial [Proteobacteria bacterium]|nr:hypothetical protein [Pseudomonadota bacterium]
MTPARRLALAALLAGVALAPAPVAQGAARWHAGADRFLAPATPMRLVREWRRSLPDGKEIVSRRTYAVQFVSEGDGFRLDGHLLSVEVEAPAKLEGLARIERARPDEGLFPIRLDASGAIASSAPAPDGSARARAGEIGGTMLGRGVSPGEARDGATFVQQWQAGTPVTRWPADLFRPQRGERREARPIQLADGAAGEVEVVTAAQCDD